MWIVELGARSSTTLPYTFLSGSAASSSGIRNLRIATASSVSKRQFQIRLSRVREEKEVSWLERGELVSRALQTAPFEVFA
jgi:hypothetical protein